jgi:hypothetical protein
LKKKPTFKETIVYKFYSAWGHFFKFLLNVFSLRKLSANREISDLNLLFFCGLKGAKMLKPVLLSIYYRWEKIPNLTIVSDGTPEEYISRYMKFWPFPYQIKMWTEAATHFQEKGKTHLVRYAEKNIMGRKLISILAEGEARPTLYCDTDVLWFAEPSLPANLPGKSFTMRMSADNVHCYSHSLIKELKAERLFDKKPLNAGVMYISGSVFENFKGFERIAEALPSYSEFVSEQTTFALIAEELGDTWSLEDIMVSTEDIHWPIIPGYFFQNKNFFARHHVLTKNSWFWRDALYLVLFKRKQNPVTETRLNPGRAIEENAK